MKKLQLIIGVLFVLFFTSCNRDENINNNEDEILKDEEEVFNQSEFLPKRIIEIEVIKV